MYFDLNKIKLAEKIFVIIRGLPSTGKSTIAKLLTQSHGVAICVDEYLTTPDGDYCFTKDHFIEAQKMCKIDCEQLMKNNTDLIVLHNTMAEAWESKDYFEMAQNFGYQTHVLNLYDSGNNDQELANRNHHAMPSHLIQKMRQKWDIDIFPHRQKHQNPNQNMINRLPNSSFFYAHFSQTKINVETQKS